MRSQDRTLHYSALCGNKTNATTGTKFKTTNMALKLKKAMSNNTLTH